MELAELVNQVAGFDGLGTREKCQLFAWWLHTEKKLEFFASKDVSECFKTLHLAVPNVSQALQRMAKERIPPDLLKQRGAYKLQRALRAAFDARYGIPATIVQISKLLSDLPAQVANIEERAFLQEALKCYRVEAYRSCIVMTWNLAYAHLLDWILSDPVRLSTFNSSIVRRYQSLRTLQITKYDDFTDELKERQVIEIASTAGLFNANVFKILLAKLDRRNTVAHPAAVKVVQSQADDTVTDLVNNVILALN